MLSNAEFLDAMYQHVFLRTADEAGKTGFQSRLDQGLTTRAQVIETFLNSPEIQGVPTSVAGVYQAVLGRQPDMSGLQFWAGVLQTGAGLAQIAQSMVTSPEFLQKYAALKTPTEQINQIYQNALGREADAPGMAYWEMQLQYGSSLGSVAASIALSPEARARNDMNMKKTLLWHAIVGNEPAASDISSLPDDASALAVAMMQQPTAPVGPGPFWETLGKVYGNTEVAGAVSLDLVKNSLLVNGQSQSLAVGSLPAGVNVDFTGLTLAAGTKVDTAKTPQLVTFVGDSAVNVYAGSGLGDSIDAGYGNDQIALGAGKDVLWFASTALMNGVDTIENFVPGTDQLNFSRFLNKTTASVGLVAVDSTKPVQKSWTSGDLLVAQGEALDTPADIAGLFGAGGVFAAPRGAAKVVLITADVVGDAKVWYVVNQSDTSQVTSNEVAQVAVLKGVNNLLEQNTLASLLASTQVTATAGAISYDASVFEESARNDGSVSNTLTLTLVGDTFKGAAGASIGKVEGVPSGMTARLVKVSDTEATLTLTGKAKAHSFADSIESLKVTFTDKEFASGIVAAGAVRDDLSVLFFDLNAHESDGVLSVTGSVPAALVIDLGADTMTSGSKSVLPLTGELENVTTVDLTGVVAGTTAPVITVNGSSGSDLMVSAPSGATLKGAGGVDGYLLGAGVDKVVFESSAVGNGIDVISGFKVGTGGDVLNFSAFLNSTGKTNVTTRAADGTAAIVWNNGDVLVVQGYSVDTPAEVAALFGAGAVYAAPTGQAKVVVIASDLVGDATVWYVTNQASSGITTIDASEVEQVAVLQDVNNLSLVGMAPANFA